MKKSLIIVFLVLLVIIGIAYSRNKKNNSIIPQAVSYDSWIGTWTGPEGTALTLSKNESIYNLDFVMLDGPVSVMGTPIENGIAFTRMGQTHTLRHGTGLDTGMKWLTEKNDCLVVQQSEGYCRD